MAYQPGEDVFKEEPFAYIGMKEFRDSVCDFCLKQPYDDDNLNTPLQGIGRNRNYVTLKKCGNCKLVFYCNSTCQKAAWKSHHRDECRYLCGILNAKIKNNQKAQLMEMLDINMCKPRLMLRIYLKLQNGGDEEFIELPDGSKSYFSDLTSLEIEDEDSDSSSMFKMKIFMAHYVSLVNLHSLSKENMPDQGLCADIFCKMNMFNLYPVLDYRGNIVALGLYLGASGMEKSCKPTAKFFHTGKTLNIRTIGNASSFSDLTIGVGSSPFITTAMRRKWLKLRFDVKNYHCECTLCEDGAIDQLKTSLKCPSCKEGCVPIATKICIDCNQEIDGVLLAKYRKLLPRLNAYRKGRHGDELYDEALKIFHPYDFFYMAFVNAYFKEMESTCLSARMLSPAIFQKFLEIVEMRLKFLYKHFVPYEVNIGWEERQIALIYNALCKFDQADEHIEKARRVFEVNFGHPDVNVSTDEWESWKEAKKAIDARGRGLGTHTKFSKREKEGFTMGFGTQPSFTQWTLNFRTLEEIPNYN